VSSKGSNAAREFVSANAKSNRYRENITAEQPIYYSRGAALSSIDFFPNKYMCTQNPASPKYKNKRDEPIEILFQ
jgi:hypothetical protein